MWERLWAWLGFRRRERGEFRLESPLAEHVYRLAEQERRPPEAVAADLLSAGLVRRRQAHELLERWRSLSPRQQEVAALICLGYSRRQIARRLVISPETVKTHTRHILLKFDLHSHQELRLLFEDWDFSAWES